MSSRRPQPLSQRPTSTQQVIFTFIPSRPLSNKQIETRLSLRALASLVSRLSALIAHNRVRASARNVSTLLASVAHRLILALARLVARLLAAAAHDLVLAVSGEVAGLQAAVAGIEGHEAEEAARTRSTPHLCAAKVPFPSLGTRRSLGAVASNVARFMAEMADDLIAGGLRSENEEERTARTWEPQRPEQQAQAQHR